MTVLFGELFKVVPIPGKLDEVERQDVPVAPVFDTVVTPPKFRLPRLLFIFRAVAETNGAALNPALLKSTDHKPFASHVVAPRQIFMLFGSALFFQRWEAVS